MSAPRIMAGTDVRWCIHCRPCDATRVHDAIVLNGTVQTYRTGSPYALVTVRDHDGRDWINRDVYLPVTDLTPVARVVALRPRAL
ncbi:hypothetical protein [Thalassobaculum sp.]|uniref:hypothetical protein n=1 Tax=Thalassobaculum sp. TaxID=2022740 RepID=UPI0032EEFD4D